jgi:hypothetical protein
MMISTEMSQFLSSMDYPAHRHDLVREATRDGLNVTDLARLAEVTPRSYSGKLDVMLELKWKHGGLLEPLHPPVATPA